MEITQGGGSSRRRTPLHETDKFREVVRRIKEREAHPEAPLKVEPNPVEFHVPLPTPTQEEDFGQRARLRDESERNFIKNQVKTELYDYLDAHPGTVPVGGLNDYIEAETEIRYRTKKNKSSMGDTSRSRHQSRVENIERRELYKTVRKAVEESTAQAPAYARKEREENIEKNTERLVNTIRKPRYVFLSDGTPFFLNREDERAELERSLLDESPLKRRWMLAKYDMATGVERFTRLIDEGSQKTKEFVTDTGVEGNVIGATLQLALNSALLGVEYLKFADYPIFVSKEKAEALRKEAEAVKFTDPERAAALAAKAEGMEQGVKLKEQYNTRLRIAGQAVDRSWARLFGEFEEGQENIKEVRAENPDASPQEISILLAEKFKEKEATAQANAADLRTQAADAYAQGDVEKAIQLTKDAIEQEREGKNGDAYGAYTWIREPDRYEKFLEDAALLELQKGDPLTVAEVRRLKEYHANTWTELTGEFAFDPTNLIPAVVLEKAIGIPLKTVSKVVKVVAKEVPIVGKTAAVMGKPLRWLLRQSVRSGAEQIARRTNTIFQNISNAYLTSEEVIKAIDDVSDVVLDAKRAATQAEAVGIFDVARRRVPGLQRVTFGEFKELMDAAEHVDPTEWGKLYSDSLQVAAENLAGSTRVTGKQVSEAAADFSKNRWALGEMSNKFATAFADPHRIYKGSRLTDDTIGGWVVGTLRRLGDEEINDALKVRKFDEWANNVKLGDNWKRGVRAGRFFLEASLYLGATIRDFWAMAVLTTFRWPGQNLIDTAARSVVHGGNMFDDLGTLFMSTQRLLVDELGFAPLEINNALARVGLDFTDQVPNRLLYENWKPRFGIFSYISEEYRRLETATRGSRDAAKYAIIDKMVSGLPDGKFKQIFASVADGMNYRVNLANAIRAMPGGIQDFNTAIEFTYRLRMFHKQYFELLKKLEPEFAERGMEALTPATRDIARQIWIAADGNPNRVTAYADNLIGSSKGTPAKWSFAVPPDMDDIFKDLPLSDQNLLLSTIKNEIDQFVVTKLRNGEEITGDDFRKLFDDLKKKSQDEIQHRMSMTHDHKAVDGSIKKDGKPNEVPVEESVRGSFPLPEEKNLRNAEIEEAIGNLSRKNRKHIKPLDIHKDFETAISNYAKVERVAGDGMRLVEKDGELVIEVGDKLLKKRKSAYYNAINNTMIEILKKKDVDTILRSGFKDLKEYDDVARKFLVEPTAVLNENERQFIMLVDQMETNPQLRQIIEQTSPETVREYDKALDQYREIGAYSDEYGFTTPPEKLFQSEAEKLRPVPGSHTAAVHANVAASSQLRKAAEAASPEVLDSVREYLGYMDVYRKELKQFYTFTYPGPLMKSTRDATRHTGWDIFYRLSEAEFTKETEITNRIIELIQKNPEEAKAFLDNTNGNFAEFFLEQNGIKLTWDADRQTILNIQIKGIDGRIKNFTQRKEIALLQSRFFSPRTRKALEGTEVMRVAKDGKHQLRTLLAYSLRNTFEVDTAHATAWARVINNHAEKWAQETGRPIEEYYARLGFQRVESSSAKGLPTLERTRVVKRGAVGRTEDGNFLFYGLSHSNFESMVRETSELFFDDLASMAEHSPQAADDLNHLKKFLEEKTGKKIRKNTLEKSHSDILTDTFTEYIATGHGPDINIKHGFSRLKKWLTQTFDAVRDSKVAGEIPDDTYRILDRMFTEAKMYDVPKTNSRTIRLMAKEAGLGDDEETLLKTINDALAQPTLTPEQDATRKALEETLQQKREELDALNQRISETTDDMRDAFMVAHGSDLRAMQAEAEETAKALEDFDANLTKPQAYTSLGDVPLEVAARVLGTPETPLESQVLTELQQGWEVWRTNRSLKGFPEEALTDPDTFKDYLRGRIEDEWDEVGAEYNRLLWEVEQFEDAMLNYHAGDDLRTVIFPRVHEAQMSDGMKTFIRNRETLRQSHDTLLQALDRFSDYYDDLAKNGHPVQLLTKDEQAALKAWAYEDGSKAKAEMLSTILNGSDDVEGAIPFVNKRMLDYQNTNVFDQFMKNWFPFWMFPSRSLPFWAETLATHPYLIAAYEKVQRLSRSQRYQAGAVTSQGKPLPSLDGYIKIPGTDMWFNPLAPLSFRYLLDIQKAKDDIYYAGQSQDEVDPMTFLTSELMQTGQIYGFSLAPWAAYFLKGRFGIPDEIIPRYPLIPEIPLIPRWWTKELVQRTNEMFNVNLNGLHDTIYPEVPWHDYTVEIRILEHALAQVQSGNLTQAQKSKIISEAQKAIKEKGENALWQQTYREVTTDESVRSLKSVFSGLYVKNYGDGEANLLALRSHRNLLKSALNNEFQAEVFGLPVDAESAYNNYLADMDTPEGWIYRLYTDVGWVKNAEGDLVRDPQERAIWLAKKIEMDEEQQVYYDLMSAAQTSLQEELRALPVGTDWEIVKGVYDRYYEKVQSYQYLRTFEKYYGSNKPVELIQRDMMNDWFRKLKSSKPQWNASGGETYDDYQQRVTEWEMNLPQIAARYIDKFRNQDDVQMTIAKLHPDQHFDTEAFFNQLVEVSTREGLLAHEKQNDDIFDALNKAWSGTYWDDYWNSVIGKDGYEVDLAEQQFYQRHPEPPSTNELYSWIIAYYGPDKFTLDEIAKYTEDSGELTVEQRRLQGQDDPEDYTMRQEIWDMLSWRGPGNKNLDVFNTALANAGGDPDWLTTWYDEGGQAFLKQPEKLKQLHDAVQGAVTSLGLQPPTRAETVRYVRAQHENDAFQNFVKDELGDTFYETYDYYNNLGSYDAKSQFRSDFPEEYDKISQYYNMKEGYAEEHPVWADYYGFDTEPSVSLPTDDRNSVFVPPSRRTRDRSSDVQRRPTAARFPEHNVPRFNINSRTGSYVSPGLYNLVGNKMAGEIAGLFSSNRRISSAGVSFLRSVGSRYPEYQDDIQRILERNSSL